MSEVSSIVENEPPQAAPVITTRAKVVRESFTVLRSDFEPAATVAVRPQRPAAEPEARGGGQSNIALTVGGGVLLVGGIFAFLFFGYGSNKGAPTPSPTAAPKGAAEAAVTPVHAAKDPKPIVHAAPVTKPSAVAPVEHHAVAVAPHVAPTPHKEPVESAANRVAIHIPQNVPEASHPAAHERQIVHEEPKPVAQVDKPKPVVHTEQPTHHTVEAHHETAPPVSHHHDDSTDLDPLHSLGN